MHKIGNMWYAKICMFLLVFTHIPCNENIGLNTNLLHFYS